MAGGQIRVGGGVEEFVADIRQRRGPEGVSLRDVEAMLLGYNRARAALSVDAEANWPDEEFAQWLWNHYGQRGSHGWAAEIERRATTVDAAIDEFLRLLARFRSECAAGRGDAADRPDYGLWGGSFVTLFWRRDLFGEVLADLAATGYRVLRVEAGFWHTAKDMHRDIAAALAFPGYYGRNLDALNECLGDVACHASHDRHGGGRLAIGLADYDHFAAECPYEAHALLDIISCQARNAATSGRRLLGLVHSNDPHIAFGPVGAAPVRWNDREWFSADRS